MKKPCPWKVLSEEVYESFPIFTLKKSTRVNPVSGAEIGFVRIEGLNWVNIIAFTEKDELILVRQYRHGAEEYTLELPGGCVEKDEDPLQSGLRELKEETGYLCEHAEFLTMLHPNPAMYSMKNFYFVARNCKLNATQALDAGEDIEVILKPYAEVVEDLKNGLFTHGMGAAGLALFELSRRGAS